jgi:uncharacterized protein involved in outer membrane biogenesis
MRERKKGLMMAGGVVLLIIVAVIAAVLLFDINSYKLKIETAVSETTGLDVRIKGKIGLSFFPLGISAKDILVANRGNEILRMESLKLHAELISLLKKQLKVTACELVSPAVTIVKDVDGKFNFENIEVQSPKERPGQAFGLGDLKLSKGSLVYLDKKTGKKTELKEINLAVRDVSVADTSGGIIKNISFTGSFACKELTQKDLRIENLRAPVKAVSGVFSFKPLTMDIFGGKGEGNVMVDETAHDPEYKINLKISKLHFEKLQESFGIKKSISGTGDLAALLTIKEKGRNLMQNLDGTFSLKGDNLVTHTVDLDKILSSYEASQKFNLIDIGAFLIVGPLGNVALQGYRYGNFYYQSQGGQGTIVQFVSHWNIKNGEADAVDCALATSHNRIALIGKLNLVSEKYDNITVSLLDDKGCAILTQTISGPFGHPQIGAVNAVASLAGPIIDLYRKAKRFVQAGNCTAVYNGSVQQPR